MSNISRIVDLPEGWEKHDGGECPVPLDSYVLVMYEDYEHDWEPTVAGFFAGAQGDNENWWTGHNAPEGCCITAYKLVKSPNAEPASESFDDMIERVSSKIFPILWRQECYNGVTLESVDSFRIGGSADMGGRVENYEKQSREIAREAIMELFPKFKD